MEDIFYPPRDRDLYKPLADQAKAICRGRDGRPECSVRWDCLWAAIDSDEEHGIWGGMSHRERNATVRKWQQLKKQGRTKKALNDYIMDGLQC